MDSMNEGDGPQEFQRHFWLNALGTIQKIAETMRAEFGDAIDAHPGGVGVEAGTVNRAFRMAARVVLQSVSQGDDLDALLARALRQAAMRRLSEIDAEGQRIEILLGAEPNLGDRWLAYLALAPETVIEDLIGGQAGR